MEKRYQVFVSSTYEDLKEERTEVIQALLELDCFPAGMELFPASTESQWNWIKKIIDESDYYILILGGRYGTISSSTNIGYVEMEYKYAVDSLKPTIAFIHDNIDSLPSSKVEKDPDKIKRYTEFKKLIETKLCKKWTNSSDLGAKVSRSITQLIKSNPAVGWVRAFDGTSKEKEKKGVLPVDLHVSKESEEYKIEITYTIEQRVEKNGRKYWRNPKKRTIECVLKWEDIFREAAKDFIDGKSEWDSFSTIKRAIINLSPDDMYEVNDDERITEFVIPHKITEKLLLQFFALKFIDKESGKYKLTENGKESMFKLMGLIE
jgi:hypothetical protein